MTTVSPSLEGNYLLKQNGMATAPAAESGTGYASLAAGNTISYANQGNTILHFHCTTSGTGTLEGLVSANNVSLTFSSSTDYYIGPLDPALYGQTVTISTATAVGTMALYSQPYAFFNAEANPFETTVTNNDYPYYR